RDHSASWVSRLWSLICSRAASSWPLQVRLGSVLIRAMTCCRRVGGRGGLGLLPLDAGRGRRGRRCRGGGGVGVGGAGVAGVGGGLVAGGGGLDLAGAVAGPPGGQQGGQDGSADDTWQVSWAGGADAAGGG